MDQTNALRKVAEIVETNYRHPNYDRTVELYEDYLTLSTGEGSERFLERFSSREDEMAFAERLRVTVDICKSVVKNLTHVFARVCRSIGIKIEIGVDDTKRDDFNTILSKYGRYGLDGYMQRRFTDFCKIDPNGFLVVEFKPTDGREYAQPYPIEYYSPDVIDFYYDLSVLEYLCVKQDVYKKNVGGIEQEVHDFTIYTADGAVKLSARPDIENAPAFDASRTYVTGDLVGFHKRPTAEDEDKEVADVYEIIIPIPYYLGETPARRVGYLANEVTRGESFINFFDNAAPFLKKIIKVNSESDISACKHAFPQRIQFVRDCPNNCELDHLGVFMKDGRVCQTCGGNGFIDAHRSGLDCIYIPMNEETKDIDIENIVKYVAVPIDTLEYQDNKIQSLIEMCKRVIYNTDIFSKQEISDTATSKLIEMENMYDTIYTYAVHYGAMYQWQLEMIGKITDIEVNPVVSVSKDFKLLTKAQIIEMLTAAKTAGASPQIIKLLNDELAYAFLGNSDSYRNYLEGEKMLPFGDKSPEEKMLILSQLGTNDPYRVKYLFGGEILKAIIAEYDNYFMLNDEVRQTLFDKKVQELIAQLTPQQPEPQPPQFGE